MSPSEEQRSAGVSSAFLLTQVGAHAAQAFAAWVARDAASRRSPSTSAHLPPVAEPDRSVSVRPLPFDAVIVEG